MAAGISATFTPAEFETRDVSGANVAVIDCLRASTSIVKALAAGARAVFPVLSVEDARIEARRRPGAVLAGERGGAKIEGFDLGNSPSEFTPASVGGKDIVMTTTNGTRLLTVASHGAGVYVAAFVNASATARALVQGGREIVLAAAGTQGLFSVEDSLCAGLIASIICADGGCRTDDSAAFAIYAWECAGKDFTRAVISGKGARNVAAVGLEADIADCLEIDSAPVVAMALRDPLRVARIETA